MFTLLAQQDGSNAAGGAVAAAGCMGGCVFMIIWLAVIVLVIAGFWKTFTKAGQPGWASIIPILNLIVLIQIAGKPIWWIVFFLIPIANIVVMIMIDIEIAKRFGKGTGFGLGLAFLAPIFYPILGFGSAQYQGPPIASILGPPQPNP